MKTEKQLQDYLKNTAKRSGVSFYKMECVGQTGFPDVLLTYQGHSIYIELKSPAKTGRLSERQKFMLNKLTNQGIENYVISQPEEAYTLITGLIEREPKPSYRPLI